MRSITSSYHHTTWSYDLIIYNIIISHVISLDITWSYHCATLSYHIILSLDMTWHGMTARHGIVTNQQVVIPVVCFAVCVAFQAWEFAGKHDETTRVRSLFAAVRAGWVKVTMIVLRDLMFVRKYNLLCHSVSLHNQDFRGVNCRIYMMITAVWTTRGSAGYQCILWCFIGCVRTALRWAVRQSRVCVQTATRKELSNTRELWRWRCSYWCTLFVDYPYPFY